MRLKTNKYGNNKNVYRGIKFDSERERDRYIFLNSKLEKGEITDLRLQEKFELLPKVTHIEIKHLKTKYKEIIHTDQQPITYRSDFSYYRNGIKVVEDVKISEKMIPDVFKIKEKMFFYKYGFRITRIYDSSTWTYDKETSR